MKNPVRLSAVAALLAFALVAAACGGITNPRGWAAATVEGDTAYVFDKKDRFSAFDLDDRGIAGTRWQFPDDDIEAEKDVDLEAVYGTPLVDGGTFYFAGFKGEVDAIDIESGRLLWRQDEFDGEVVGGLVQDGNKLFFATLEGEIFALDTDEGGAFHEEWPEGGVDVGDDIWASPVLDGDNLIVATMEGTVHAYSAADGSEAWPDPFETSSAVPEIALVEPGVLFAGGLNKSVYLLDTATGETLHEYKADDWVWTQPALDGEMAYFGDFAGTVHALDTTTGEGAWQYDAGSKIKGSPALVDGTLVVATEDAVVHFIDVASGERLNEVPLSGAGTVRANLVAAGDVVYIVTTKGKLYRADPEAFSVVEAEKAGSGS